MRALALILALAFSAHGAEPAKLSEVVRTPGVKKVIGKCQGGDRPSVGCKTCAHCAYCGTDKGRGVNSATCAVCAAAKAAR